MNLIIDNEITLVTESAGEMVNGVYKKNEDDSAEKIIKCNVQPSSREKTYSEYGYVIDAEYTVYCYVDTDIKEGMTVKYKDEEYTIIKLVDWTNYYILYLKAVL